MREFRLLSKSLQQRRCRALGVESLELRRVMAAEIVVEWSGQNIADGTLLTGGPAGLQFGSLVQHEAGPARVFTVRNTGNSNLTLGSVNLPDGFVLDEALSALIGPGSSDTFTVRLDTANVGPKSGELFFVSNDLDETLFDFEIAGEVLEPPAPGAWQNPVDPLNVDGQPGIVPLDALIVINELNGRTFTHPLTGALPAPTSGRRPPPYYDVTGDGYVTPLDALRVINHLNNPSAPAGGEGETTSALAEELYAAASFVAPVLPLHEPTGFLPANAAERNRNTAEKMDFVLEAGLAPLCKSPAASPGLELEDEEGADGIEPIELLANDWAN